MKFSSVYCVAVQGQDSLTGSNLTSPSSLGQPTCPFGASCEPGAQDLVDHAGGVARV